MIEKFDCLNQIWPWRSRSIATQNDRDLHQAIFHLWSKFGGPNLNGWWVMVRTSSKWGKFWFWSWIWPWRSGSIAPQNNRGLNQGHLWPKFGDPSLNGSQVIARTSKWLTHRLTHTHTDTHTDAGDDNTRRQKLASGKNRKQRNQCFDSALIIITLIRHPLLSLKDKALASDTIVNTKRSFIKLQQTCFYWYFCIYLGLCASETRAHCIFYRGENLRIGGP